MVLDYRSPFSSYIDLCTFTSLAKMFKPANALLRGTEMLLQIDLCIFRVAVKQVNVLLTKEKSTYNRMTPVFGRKWSFMSRLGKEPNTKFNGHTELQRKLLSCRALEAMTYTAASVLN